MDHRLSKALKSGLVSLLRRSGLASPLRERLGGAGVILVLHEIHDDLACKLMTGCSPSLLNVVVNSDEKLRIIALDLATPSRTLLGRIREIAQRIPPS